MNNRTSHGREHHSSGNRHHANEELDAAEVFKRSSMSLQRKRKILSKLTFIILCVVAVIVVALCVVASI